MTGSRGRLWGESGLENQHFEKKRGGGGGGG